nr:Chain G, Auxin-responsive protein IAA10 [Arabidopsis thaliana]5C7E_H Chain H, Auxin-responsive protein IAA10 [Arabidopsis thaliana]5C7E_I Chain I, Auxin-responsive protein IAA10 [Arabidopsis thaliana]5C7E_J Chain J, Auxin-responsive protein IAA10 [Arabidopsis thaliana]5C7E_K Chain K, Auxin-responsive protein IAA10 [Arabidopsis thaliana]5C7E_L Chain L, Auxin-responsive protein IAA10 [Arabidopsis thaliana]
SETELDLALGL